MRGAGRLYALHMALAAMGLALLTAGATVVVAHQQLSLPSSRTISEACGNWLSAGGPEALLGLGIALTAVTALGRGLASVSRQIKATRRFMAELPIESTQLVHGKSCSIFEGGEPQAFCAGLLRPSIYLSQGSLMQLERAELAAVVAHEAHHQSRRDPLRLFAVRAFADSLFFLPILRRTSERFSALGELAADNAAVRATRGRGPLAAALLKFEQSSEPAPVVAIAPERVDHLLGVQEAGRWNLPGGAWARTVLAFAVTGGSAFAIWHGVLDPGMQMPLLLAAVCMGLMVCGPALLAVAALLVSRRTLQARRT